MSRLSRGARRLCVLCVGSANEIPLQNSSALLGSVVPIWLCRLRRVGLFSETLLGLLCSALAVLYARADGFAAALISVINATRQLLQA